MASITTVMRWIFNLTAASSRKMWIHNGGYPWQIPSCRNWTCSSCPLQSPLASGEYCCWNFDNASCMRNVFPAVLHLLENSYFYMWLCYLVHESWYLFNGNIVLCCYVWLIFHMHMFFRSMDLSLSHETLPIGAITTNKLYINCSPTREEMGVGKR